MTSPLMSRMMFAYRAGLQFGGRRNLYEVFGYPRILTSPLLYGKYQRQDIVTRIVNMPPEEMWSKLPVLKEGTAAKTGWEAFVKRTQLKKRIIQADKLCSFGPFSVILLGLSGGLDKPAPKKVKPEDVLYASVYGGDSVRISEYVEDTRDPRFGLPKMYQIQNSQTASGSMQQGINPTTAANFRNVDASRVIHIVDRPVQGDLLGEPRLQQVYNILEDLLKIAGGSAELYWILGNRGMQVDVDKEMDLDPADAAALTEELDEFQHNLRRFVRTRGVKINPLGAETADPRGQFEIVMALLAATTNIPQRILMGAEAGQLASEQDRANWAEYIERRRTAFGVPYVLQPAIRKLGELGIVDADAWMETDDDAWEWQEAFHMNPVEKSNALASKARAVVNLARRNQFGDPVLSDQECRVMMGFPEEVPAGHTMPEAPQPANATGGTPGGQSDTASAKGVGGDGTSSASGAPAETNKATNAS